MTEGTHARARRLLSAIAGPGAEFRVGQLETITELADRRARLLLVQRTGWGKSAVYLIATRILREGGAGPTLLVSPLLALMRNQIDMARRGGVAAASINSANTDEWERVRESLAADEVDLLLVSPERLSNPDFRAEALPALARRSGLLVIDEAHCISDWGHDFRPDYRRLARVVELLPRNVPVLGTTATANDRVVADVAQQLGLGLALRRGSLDRESLRLHARTLPDQAQRLAWLATNLDELAGSGIVYCLTKGDTERVAAWLRTRDIDAVAYHGGLPDDERLAVERRLLANEVRVVAATSALGMGFDKPDLAFVVHFQAPASVIDYYQQVGRAGRALPSAVGVLLSGYEDRDIQDYFIESAFPPQPVAEEVVRHLEDAARPVSSLQIQAHVNVRKTRLDAALKILEVEGAVERAGGKWQRTLNPWDYDGDRVRRVTTQRRAEQETMDAYLATGDCRMRLLRHALDDRDPAPCGRCDNCTGEAFGRSPAPEVVAAAVEHLRWQTLEIAPRKQWPAALGEPQGRIAEDRRAEPGRCLSVYGDAGWGRLVADAKAAGRFGDDLVEAVVQLVGQRWRPEPPPTWVTFIPSLRRPDLVADLANRVADALGLPCRDPLAQHRATQPQKTMENSAQQVSNVYGAFAVQHRPLPEPVLLIDDIVDSRWTITVAAVLLREAGSGPVHPLALADAQPG